MPSSYPYYRAAVSEETQIRIAELQRIRSKNNNRDGHYNRWFSLLINDLFSLGFQRVELVKSSPLQQKHILSPSGVKVQTHTSTCCKDGSLCNVAHEQVPLSSACSTKEQQQHIHNQSTQIVFPSKKEGKNTKIQRGLSMESYVSLRKRAKLDILLTSEGPKPPKGKEKKVTISTTGHSRYQNAFQFFFSLIVVTWFLMGTTG